MKNWALSSALEAVGSLNTGETLQNVSIHPTLTKRGFILRRAVVQGVGLGGRGRSVGFGKIQTQFSPYS